LNKKKIILAVIASIVVIIGAYFGYTNLNKKVITNYANFDTDKANGCKIDNDIISIDKGGTYDVSGSTTNGYIIVNTSDDVELVLDNVNINSKDNAPIRVEKANSIKITIKDNSTNTLTGGDNKDYGAVIASNSPIIIEGNGTLNINSSKEGIEVKNNDITINSGTIIIKSADDGINAGGDGGLITINNGTIYVDAQGDGIDSNKDLIINNGALFIMGSAKADNGSIDTDGKYQINGGTVVGLSNAMLQSPDADSNQKTILFYLDNAIDANTLITLSDDTNNVSFIADRSFKTLTISSPKIVDGTYHLYTGGTNTGKLNYGIYSDGSYTKGNIVTISNMTDFNINSITNWFGNTDDMRGQPNNIGGLIPQY